MSAMTSVYGEPSNRSLGPGVSSRLMEKRSGWLPGRETEARAELCLTGDRQAVACCGHLGEGGAGGTRFEK